MIFVGIDPGLTGGIAAVDDKGAIVYQARLPLMPSFVPKRKMLDAREFAAVVRFLQQRQGLAHCAVEQVGAMPKQGVVGTFSFGMGFGALLGVLGAMQASYVLVRPQEWKKHHALGADKAQAIGLAMRKWPELTLKKSDDGVAEALLIADWLRAGYVR